MADLVTSCTKSTWMKENGAQLSLVMENVRRNDEDEAIIMEVMEVRVWLWRREKRENEMKGMNIKV